MSLLVRTLVVMLITLILTYPASASYATGPVSILINDEPASGVDVYTGENGIVYGRLGPLAEAIGITIEQVTGCEDYVPVSVFLMTHGFEIEIGESNGAATEIRAYREYEREPYEVFIPDESRAYRIRGFFTELYSDHWNGVHFVDFNLSINALGVEADLEVRENGRAYVVLGPLAEALGYDDEEILNCRDYVPIAAFFRSHGFTVEWVEDVLEHPYVAVYRMKD